MNRAAHIVFGTGIAFFILARFFPASHIPLIVAGSGIGSVFPDLDRRRGHRKLLHNIFSLIFFSLLLLSGTIYLQLPITFSLAYSLGYASHLLGDIITYRGVAILYPFKNKYYRSPIAVGRSGDLGVNLLGIFLGAILIILGMQGLRT